MSATSNSTQAEFLADAWSVRRSVAAPAARPTYAEDDHLPGGPFPINLDALDNIRPLAFARYLIAFFVGIAATLAWQSYGGAAREMIAPIQPSPYQEQLIAMSLDIDAVRQSVDRMMTSFAVSQNQMTRSIDQLRIGQDWIARDFADKLKVVEQDILDKIATPAPRAASALVSKPIPQSPRVATTR